MMNKIKGNMKKMILIPLILLLCGNIITMSVKFVTYQNKSLNNELHNETFVVAAILANGSSFDTLVSQSDATTEENLTNLLNTLKSQTKLEYSFIAKQVRVSTTFENNKEYINDSDWLRLKNELKVQKKTQINGKTYYVSYTPLKENGILVGAIEVAKAASEVYIEQIKELLPVFIIFILFSIITIIIMVKYFLGIGDCINTLSDFTNYVANEKFNRRLTDSIYERTDELGLIGRNITLTRNMLKDLLERDTLTELYNKRTGINRLEAIKEKCTSNNTPYCVAMGDIDYFKMINNNYGDSAGDTVLKEIAFMLKKQMKCYGILAKWENDEILLGFEDIEKNKAQKILNDIINELHRMTIEYNGTVIDVTMTFGLVSNSEAKSVKDLINIAKDRLQYGKDNGRNQIVTE